jgi:hypothetical protein
VLDAAVHHQVPEPHVRDLANERENRIMACDRAIAIESYKRPPIF